MGQDLIPLNLALGVTLDLIPSISPLGVGLDLIPLNFPLGCGPGGGVSLEGGCLLLGGPLGGGASFLGGGCGIPACTEAEPPVNRITHSCKNITLATTSLRPAMNTLVNKAGESHTDSYTF